MTATERSAVNVEGTIPLSDSAEEDIPVSQRPSLTFSLRDMNVHVNPTQGRASEKKGQKRDAKSAKRVTADFKGRKVREMLGKKRKQVDIIKSKSRRSRLHERTENSTQTIEGPGGLGAGRSRGVYSSDSEGEDSGEDGEHHGDDIGHHKRAKKSHYSEEEALQVAMSWVAQSEDSANQKGELFWDGVCAKLEKSTGFKRGVESVRCLWKRMNKECALYLSLKEEVEKRGSTSGRSEKHVEQMVSDLFTQRTGRINKEGIRIAGPPFRYRRVADYLSSQPKWERQGRRVKRSSGVEMDAHGASRDDVDSDVDSRELVVARPIGVKMKKALDKDAMEKRKFRRVLEGMSRNMAESNQISKVGGMMDRRVNLLSVLPAGSSEYKDILKLVMEDMKSTSSTAPVNNEEEDFDYDRLDNGTSQENIEVEEMD